MTAKKYIVFTIGIITLLSGWNISRSQAQPEAITLNHLETDRQKHYPPVIFYHESHMEEVECLACHHDYEDGKNVLDEDELEESSPAVVCGSCHNLEQCDDIQKTFHGLCLGCHIQSQKESLVHGPRLCVECHVPDSDKK